MQHWPMAALAGVLVLADAADAAEPPPGASSCSGCHAASPTGTVIPVLRGRAAREIAGLMREFKSGGRPATVMGRIAKGFSDDEIDSIAAWIASEDK
jgi:sulfide dehydrogenase cytochrome subunit